MALADSVSAQDSQKGKGHDAPAFSSIDQDDDGAIDAEEFYQARSKHMAERAAAGGKMKNAANAPFFESLDTNGDGELSEVEFTAHQAEMMENRQQGKANK
jgi:Ca2+-binding EF-hand superfamily protein